MKKVVSLAKEIQELNFTSGYDNDNRIKTLSRFVHLFYEIPQYFLENTKIKTKQTIQLNNEKKSFFFQLVKSEKMIETVHSIQKL